MNLEDLRAAQTRERATDGLQDLRDSFYVDVAEYIAELKAQRETAAAAADDPFGDPEVQELTDKIETAEQVAEAIYERRMGKLVKQASLAAAGMPDDANGLTDEERALYGDLVDRIESNKSHVLDVISGEAEAGVTNQAGVTDQAGVTNQAGGQSPQDATGRDADAGELGDDAPADLARNADGDAGDGSAAAAMGGGLKTGDAEREAEDPAESAAPRDASASADADSASDSGVVEADPEPPDAIAEDLAELHGDDAEQDVASESDGDDVERTTVRMTDDVGEIFGMDEREYTLEAEDVVTLPAENAEPLVERDAAEKLD